MTGSSLRCFALVLLALLVSPLAAEAAQWQWPLVEHRLSRRFDFDRSDPYRAGARRGVTLTGTPGASVLAPCSGVVSFAGLLPDRRRGVTLRCGKLAATELGLAHADVSRGEALVAGQPVGSLGSDGELSIGARVASERDGYRDPLALLAAPPQAAPLAPLAPRGSRIPSAPQPSVRAGFAATNQARPQAPWLIGAAGLGLGISGAAIGAGIALGGRRERRARLAVAVAQPQRRQ